MLRTRMIRLAPVALVLPPLRPTAAHAAPPSPDNGGYETFICPAVSLHNAKGTWVLGAHGAYYVNVVTRGVPEPMKTNKVFVKVDSQGRAVAQAQVPAGYALYSTAFPDAFNPDHSPSATSGFYTSMDAGDAAPDAVMLLGEGIANWLSADAEHWAEGDMATVVDNGDGTYTVTNQGGPMGMSAKGQTVTVDPTGGGCAGTGHRTPDACHLLGVAGAAQVLASACHVPGSMIWQ